MTSVTAVILFTVHGSRNPHEAKDAQIRVPARLYLYAGAYSVILGVEVCFMRYLGVRGVDRWTFLVN